jgi:hypothetical protein
MSNKNRPILLDDETSKKIQEFLKIVVHIHKTWKKLIFC